MSSLIELVACNLKYPLFYNIHSFPVNRVLCTSATCWIFRMTNSEEGVVQCAPLVNVPHSPLHVDLDLASYLFCRVLWLSQLNLLCTAERPFATTLCNAEISRVARLPRPRWLVTWYHPYRRPLCLQNPNENTHCDV